MWQAKHDIHQTFLSGEVTLLHLAASRGYTSVVKLLLSAGAEIDRVNTVGSIALMHAAMNGQDAVVAVLLAQDAAINHANWFRHTSLLLAVHHNRASTVQLL